MKDIIGIALFVFFVSATIGGCIYEENRRKQNMEIYKYCKKNKDFEGCREFLILYWIL